MDMGSKLEELNLTRDEMNRFGKALKDEKFRELLLEYAAEISDPENRRRYEEEITQMEEERGNSVQFIHPEANHVLKTRSARGKCFINICSNPRIGKPSCEAARDRDGEPGQNWRLPFSLTPGRADRDAAGNGCEVYDIVFHPDALHMAAKNARFMKLIHSTAIGGIEDSFHIKMDREQVKQLKMKYKGVAHPAVIRRPIPGHHQTNRSSGEDVLSFPYPDENQTAPEKEPEASQSPCNPDDIRSKQPIKPHYTVKYRSVVDLQDYRCSRDSGPGARPREIVVIIDVPLLGSALEAEVCVTERRLILEAPEPAYRLDLPLAYPVDEEKGDAKFNKTKKQLTITLPVRPAKTLELRVSCDEAKSDVNEEADQNTKEDGLHPDHTEGLAPDHIGGGLDPDHTEGLAPDHIGGCLDLDHIGAGLDPDHTEVLASDHIGGGLDPDHTEGHYSDHIEGGLDPDHKGGGLDPDHTGLASDHIGGGLDPDHTGGLDPYHTGGGLDPDHTGGGLAPDHTGGGLDPDHTGGGLDPDHTGLSSDHIGGGLDPDHTGGLDPDHTGGGLDPDHIEGLALDHTESERSQPSCDTEFEPQFTDLTRDRQTHVMSNHLIINPTENRTEPDRSVEDETNTNRAVESLSETGFVRESHRLHSRDEEAENTSLQTNDNTLIHQPTSSSVTEQEDPNSTREAEGPESKRSSGDCGSDGDAGIRSEDPVLRETSHVTSATLRFQNTLRFDLD
ncbi:protein kintoun isoform X5 [Pimephales promelas]|uniref:protein kintoun isoform X4 n=1 Tax=Pimephales promelas TaxID=90988 RepID=UPI001955A1DA|nr:protein kintoun isoform X4 [Pimephales promelas]XP_039525371.1 protein kintoun isoform X5 [Pimephales promelas]